VELAPPAGLTGAECVIELEGPRGKMRILWKGSRQWTAGRVWIRWLACARRNCILSPCLFVFRSRRGTSIRVLVYDGEGFWLARKRLSTGRFPWWPTGQGPARQLQEHQAQLLLSAGNLETTAAPLWRKVSWRRGATAG
jgi:hypothetical protein